MKKTKGFTLVEIMIVVAIIGLLAAIAIPNFVQARVRAQQGACIANLKQIDGAKQLWAIDNGKLTSDSPVVGDLVTDYIKSTPYCPADSTKKFATSYTIGTVGTAPVCQRDATNHKLPVAS